MSLRRHLVIFTRCPRYGAGKRRLAAGIGPVQALRFQRVTLSLMLRRLGADPRWTTWLAVTPDRSGPWPPRFGVLPQGQGDLGQRMARVAKVLPPGPVLIVGGDIPGIGAAAVARGFRALGDHDAVFGPATDGGYWAVGLRRRPRFLDPFEKVRWSTEHALADSLANLSGRSVASLEVLEDVDDVESLARQSPWEFLHARRRS
ncbi:TIGR04282 family arsenosugar biosynthesis glycosyltransferase [Methylocapsa aurea]|uniref:TIGR04282 family arsenosugar biosynthesis glycosyltransferase n=1 Tax=Methylocapsa aurea TaxID=663610 RepID=UPI00055DCCF1|nr:TIGR04282 family arsenosugar biosynthesis glycosyltransferase [Methylocapsa aurea]